MKKIILITMLMSAVFAQSDCNENNWKDYYNSDSKDMSDCDLRCKPYRQNAYRRTLRKPYRRNLTQNLTRVNLTGANLTRANLTRITGSDLTGANLDRRLTAKLAGGANLTGANTVAIEGVESDNIIGLPLIST